MKTIDRSRLRGAVLGTALVLALTACADPESTTETTTESTTETTTESTAMPMEEMEMNMGDPDATPAADVPGGDLVSGDFVLLDTRPSGYDAVVGTADLARHDAGTTVTVVLSGLEPGVEYISHVHAEPCSNNGGPHYQFEVGGAEVPPNEIHLLFTADADGNGFMTAENDQTVDERAVAVVVHPLDLIDNKIACADF